MKEGKRMGSRMKKMGVLFPTRSQFPVTFIFGACMGVRVT